MERRSIGPDGLALSTIGLGGMELGPGGDDVPDVANTLAVVNAAIDVGVNWIDTSENYLGTRNESLIGEALIDVDDDFLVVTKVAPEAKIGGGASGHRPEEVRAGCRGSLERLQRDRIDVYLLHWPSSDDAVPLDETWGAMAELVDDGLVRSIGLSNYAIEDIERCHAERRVDVIQDGLSLVDHLDMREKFRRCGELGIGGMVYEPLAGGVLTGRTADQILSAWVGGPWEDTPWFRRILSPGRIERSMAVADGVRSVAGVLGVTVAQVAVAWVLHQPGVSSAIAGSKSAMHTIENAGAADVVLTEVMDELAALILLGPTF